MDELDWWIIGDALGDLIGQLFKSLRFPRRRRRRSQLWTPTTHRDTIR